MRPFWAVLAASCLIASPGVAADVQSCDGKVGLAALYPPFGKHIRSLANGDVTLFNTDTDGEPVACSRGVAVTFAQTDEPGTMCFYVGCYASITDVADAVVSYDAQKGLVVEMKTGSYSDAGPKEPDKALRLTINRKTGTVKLD